MKSEILKIAGVKSEKEFYKKYPTEAAFKKAHPEAFKGVQTKHAISKAQTGYSTPGFVQEWGMNPQSQYQNTFAPSNNFAPGAYNVSNPSLNYMGGFQNSDPFAMQNYGNQWAQQNPIPANNPNSQFSNGVFGLDSNGGASQNKGQGFNTQGFGNVFFGTVKGLQNLSAEKELTGKLETWANVSDKIKDAAVSDAFAEKPKNTYNRVDARRNIKNANELSYTQGRGTDVFFGQNGAKVGGNPTEIQNTYAPDYTAYTDLEDPNEVKAYANGGGFGQWWGQANSGLSGSGDTSFMGNMGQGSPFDSFIGGQFGNNAGSQIGGSLGSLFGPVGSLAGTMIGGYFDKEPGKQAFQKSRIGANNSYISRLSTGNRFASGLNAMHVGENGANLDSGWVSNDWQPQVIATFGEHKVKDLLKPPHDADMLRAGGHLREYTPPSARAMETYENGGEMSSYAMGGQLQTHWGGHLETIAQNPYLPESGEIVMIHGKPHDKGGVGISYGGNEEGDYEGQAASGAHMKAQVEAETKEPVVQLASGGSVDPKTGKPSTEAVIFGNIPFSKHVAEATGDADLIKLAKEKDGQTYKKIIASFAAPQNKAAKTKLKAAELAEKADPNNKWGKLLLNTAQAMGQGADDTQQQFANYIKKMADLQNATQEVKKEASYLRGKNISAEELGKGKIVDDYDPITKDAEIENPYVGKSGAYLRKAQNSATVTPADGSITEEQYNNFIKLYNESQATKGKKNKSTLGFQKLYHQSFPQEALAAIQKTTRENGLSNKAKEMGLTVQDILEGKDVAKILQSNEDEYHGPRTDQYMASVRSHFKNAPDLKLNTLGTATGNKGINANKSQIGVVPYKGNTALDIFGMLSQLNRNRFPFEFDPRQLAGEYMSIAQNQEEPVPVQTMRYDLDPIYRVSYQNVRDQNTADFRDAERSLGYNPAAMAGLLGKKYLANNAVNAEEFRTNQAIEDKIFGGNRNKVNQERLANIQLYADQMNKQALAKSRTKETQQAAVASIADKYLQFESTKNKYLASSNLFPKFGYDQSYGIHTQGPGYRPAIPQIYGGKSTIEEVPVYDADGKLKYYKMQEAGGTTSPLYATPGIIASGMIAAKNGGKVSKKNNKNSSIVRALKNL